MVKLGRRRSLVHACMGAVVERWALGREGAEGMDGSGLKRGCACARMKQRWRIPLVESAGKSDNVQLSFLGSNRTVCPLSFTDSFWQYDG